MKITRMIILVGMISIALLTAVYAGEKSFPPSELVGTWVCDAELFGSSDVKGTEETQDVVITVCADGTAQGRVGGAVFKDAFVRKNRGWLGKKLNLKTDFLVYGGTLEGRIAADTKELNSKFTVPFNITNGTMDATVMLIPKFPLTAPMNMHKQCPKNRTGDAVILLHGLARTSRCMNRMETALKAEGYTVYSLSYPTREKTVEQLSEEHLVPLLEECQALHPRKIHFVTHSLGGIVLRQYFSEHELENAGRVVMLGPPNHGSEVVDKLGGFKLFDWINGPAGQQLGTASNSAPNQLPVPDLEIGVVAGTRSINLFLSTLIPGEDDGKVAVARAKLDGMSDFVTVPVSHPFLMRDKEVIQYTLQFLREGTFGNDM